MENVVLVGFSCSGKTTLGRVLARRLRLRFVDTDKLLEDTWGRTIPEIFQTDGEAVFRSMERETLEHVCAERGQVISTGGGAFITPENQSLLLEGNFVVHLQVRPDTVIHRLRTGRGSRPRPLLETPDPLQRVTELMELRRPAYNQASLSLSVDERSTYDLAADIARRWYVWRKQRKLDTEPALETSPPSLVVADRTTPC